MAFKICSCRGNLTTVVATMEEIYIHRSAERLSKHYVIPSQSSDRQCTIQKMANHLVTSQPSDSNGSTIGKEMGQLFGNKSDI